MNTPLISVCIVTYNSETTIIETLESIKKQDYSPIELIVSDDCSKDNTQKIVNEWIQENRSFFDSVNLFTLPQNSGVTNNINNAIKNSHGEWIKILAGDDLLKSNCITKCVEYTNKKHAEFFVCSLEPFCENSQVPNNIISFYKYLNFQISKSYKSKYINSAYSLEFPGPGWFFSRNCYNSVGGLDNRYPMLDEWPFTFNVLRAGFDILPIPEKLVLYRISEKSLSHNSKSNFNKIMVKQNKQFFYEKRIFELLKHLSFFKIIDQILFFKINDLQFKYFEKHNDFSTTLNFLYKYSPVNIYNKIKYKLILKTIKE